MTADWGPTQTARALCGFLSFRSSGLCTPGFFPTSIVAVKQNKKDQKDVAKWSADSVYRIRPVYSNVYIDKHHNELYATDRRSSASPPHWDFSFDLKRGDTLITFA